MNSAEQHASPVRRRYPRYEIDTELHVTTPDERATMRGRSLNISEAGTAGVFVTEWEVGTAVRLEFSVPVTSRPVKGLEESCAAAQATSMDLNSGI